MQSKKENNCLFASQRIRVLEISLFSGCEEETPLLRRVKHVLHIGIDGLAPCFVDAPGGAPNILNRMAAYGSHNLDNSRVTLESNSAPSWGSHLTGSGTETTGMTSNSWRPPWKGFSNDVTPANGPHFAIPTIFR